MCTANITSWSLVYKALIEGAFVDNIVAFQEHKLISDLEIDIAKNQAGTYGFRAFFFAEGQNRSRRPPLSNILKKLSGLVPKLCLGPECHPNGISGVPR